MKLKYETLRALYLKDLQLTYTHNGVTRPKVKHIKHWSDITPYTLGENPITINMDDGRDVWVWSDQHFGHANIIKYCNRPFTDSDSMDSQLIKNYHNTVKPDDIVIWCGDISFSHKDKINPILSSMPGYKIHVIGNHDLNRHGEPIEYAVDERHLLYTIDVMHHDINFQLLFSHYPMDNVPDGCINVCGHIHNKQANPWNIVTCVEQTNYTPVNLKVIVSQAVNYLKAYNK